MTTRPRDPLDPRRLTDPMPNRESRRRRYGKKAITGRSPMK